MNEEIRMVEVWPPLIRLLHLLLAASVSILLLTGLLMNSGMILNDRLYQHLLTVWHLPSGHVLTGVLIVRILLLAVRNDVSGWRALVPDNIRDITKMAVFYLSLARMQLPAYFAHNPLWKVLYLLMFVLLLVQVASGLLLESAWLRSVFRTDSSDALLKHQALLDVIFGVVVVHIITVLLHDWKSASAEISSIINGRKFFHIDKTGSRIQIDKPPSVSLHDLTVNKRVDD